MKNSINLITNKNFQTGDLLYSSEIRYSNQGIEGASDELNFDQEIKIERKFSTPFPKDLKDIKNRKDIYNKITIQKANIQNSYLSQAPSEIEKPEAIENIRQLFFLRDKYRFDEHSNCNHNKILKKKSLKKKFYHTLKISFFI